MSPFKSPPDGNNPIVPRRMSMPFDSLSASTRPYLCVDVLAVLELRVQQALGVLLKELHSEMHASKLTSLNGQAARLGGAYRQHQGIALLPD